MKTVELVKIRDCSDWKTQQPTTEHYSYTISEDTVFTKNGKPVGFYINIPTKDLNDVRKVVKNTNYVDTYRTSRALPTRSSVFGALPRIAIRNDYCRFTNQSKLESNHLDIMMGFGEKLVKYYKEFLPEQYYHDVKLVKEEVVEDYFLSNSHFLSCNINVNHAIKYHYDSGNFRGTLSNVLILSDNIVGGKLVFPEYGFALLQSNGALAVFDGQSEIHGVTEVGVIDPEKEFYRASIVYYSLQNMKHCYPYEEEVLRLQDVKTNQAIKKANGILPDE